MTALPYLEIGESDPDFDEAVILIEGREEETIRIECPGAAELARRLVELVNAQRRPIDALSWLSAQLAEESNTRPLTAEEAENLSRRST